MSSPWFSQSQTSRYDEVIRFTEINGVFLILPDARLILLGPDSGADGQISAQVLAGVSLFHSRTHDLAATNTFHPPTMHLMYTIDENGSRVYTLKVSRNYSTQEMVLTDLQKITETGKITKSAHPGSLF